MTDLDTWPEVATPGHGEPKHDNDGARTTHVPDVDTQHRGQARIAYRLAHRYRDRLLHVHGIGWHVWDGTRWAVDNNGHATRAVLDVLRHALADSLADTDLRTDVRKCESAAGIAGVLDIAAALEPFAATVDDLDRDAYLLNCANGTLDLHTGELRPHDPADRITKVTAAAYDPAAEGATWQTFLATILPEADVRGYFQRFIGISLLGKVLEHIFTIATGTGANGKGTAYGAILAALGDYGHVAESDLFMRAKSNPNAASPALMKLRGRRLVVVSETEQNHHLAAALMKNLTGGDKVTARPLYGAPVTFNPSHTCLMVTNHLPKVAGDDPAIWRRVRVVPFAVVIPEAERDERLGERLELETDAILSWAVAGYHDYLARGMDAPAAVRQATDQYQHDSDAVAQFIDACCVTNAAVSASTTQLHEAFTAWAREEGIDTELGRKKFGEALDNRGFPAGTRRLRKGIGLAYRGDSDE